MYEAVRMDTIQSGTLRLKLPGGWSFCFSSFHGWRSDRDSTPKERAFGQNEELVQPGEDWPFIDFDCLFSFFYADPEGIVLVFNSKV